jgi:ABC-type glutathione transport system ATPase component
VSGPVWQLAGVSVAYRRLWGPDVPVVHSVDLTIEAGERVGLVGPSGCGKTTLVRAGLGLLPVSSGTVHLFGDDTARFDRRRWSQVRQRAQLLVQDPAAMLHPHASLGLLLSDSVARHRPERPVSATVDELLRSVGLEGRHDARVHELSGGERRRAGLARVLAARPTLLVADEPTAGLDAELRADLLGAIDEQLGPGGAVVLVSHDVQALASVCDRLVFLDQGRRVAQLPTDALRAGRAPGAPDGVVRLLRAAGWVPAEEVS